MWQTHWKAKGLRGHNLQTSHLAPSASSCVQLSKSRLFFESHFPQLLSGMRASPVHCHQDVCPMFEQESWEVGRVTPSARVSLTYPRRPVGTSGFEPFMQWQVGSMLGHPAVLIKNRLVLFRKKSPFRPLKNNLWMVMCVLVEARYKHVCHFSRIHLVFWGMLSHWPHICQAG